MKKVCGENLHHSLVLKNQPSLHHYLKSSKATPRSRSTTRYQLLRRLLSRNILVILLWNIILQRCIASWNDSEASFKLRADVRCKGEWFSGQLVWICARGGAIASICSIKARVHYTQSHALPRICWGMCENRRSSPKQTTWTCPTCVVIFVPPGTNMAEVAWNIWTALERNVPPLFV